MIPSAVRVIHPTDNGVLIDVRVIARAARTGIAGVRGGALLVRLQAPPVDGAANEELRDVIAAALDVPARAISLVSGERSRHKRVCVKGISEDAVRLKLPKT